MPDNPAIAPPITSARDDLLRTDHDRQEERGEATADLRRGCHPKRAVAPRRQPSREIGPSDDQRGGERKHSRHFQRLVCRTSGN